MWSKRYVFISCLLAVVILCNTIICFAAGSYSEPEYINVDSFNSQYGTSFDTGITSIATFLSSHNLDISDISYTGPIGLNVISGTVTRIICYPVEDFYMAVSNNNGLSVNYYNSDNTLSQISSWTYYNVNTSTHTLSGPNTHTYGSNNSNYMIKSNPSNISNVGIYSNTYNYYTFVQSNNLYYTDISNEESYTNSDGVTFYTGGLSLIALAYPDFYSKLQAAAAGSVGLLEWLVNDIGAMFMLDPSTNDWYIINAPQNVAYYANDSANTITLYSGTITDDNTFKRDAGSVSFGSSADYWKHNNAVVKYNYQTQQFEYSNTFNGLTINRGANGVWINRGSSMLALDDPINEQREGLLHGRYVINNPSIGDNFDQYLDNSGDDTTVIDGDLFALLNEIKNWSQVDALTQKYLLNTLNEISSLTSEVIDYLGPNYLYPTITSYFDALFRLNGLRYSAYDQNNNKVEYNKHNKSIGDVLTEEYLMLTSVGSDNRPAQYYQYDGDVKVNPLYSLWNDIKNLPDNIASKIQPIFPTIPGSNDTIIDSVGDYNNRVSLNPQNVTDTHENLTDLLSWFHLEGFSGSFSDIFGSSDRWSLWSEETYTNCGLEVDTEE